MDPSARHRVSERRAPDGRRERRKLTHAIPLLMFAAIAAFILVTEVPAVGDWFDRMFRPAFWQARKACEEGALAHSSNPATFRVIEPGEVNETRSGYFVESMTVGEMAEGGGEQTMTYGCHVTAAGELAGIASTARRSGERIPRPPALPEGE